MAKRSFLALLLSLGLAACGEKDLIDDSLTSEDQVRSLVEQFQEAAAEQDDEAACELMDEALRSSLDETNTLVDGEVVQLPCGFLSALSRPDRELRSLPTAEIFSMSINRHDEDAEVQLDNGTRLVLSRTGTHADGEWRIASIGYLASPEDWERPTPLSRSDPRAAARQVQECLTGAGFESKALVPSPGDDDAPNSAVGFQRGAARADAGEIAIYESGVEAIDKLEALEQSIEAFSGESVPRGRAGVIFFAQPSDQTRELVLACVR